MPKLFYLLIFFPTFAYAHQGCCSHHGGVCGCECCDGKSLSYKCAPYYPECNERKHVDRFKEIETKPDSPSFVSYLWDKVLNDRDVDFVLAFTVFFTCIVLILLRFLK